MSKNLNPEKGVVEIAVIGHPNEGKSSVLSTLAEDDSVYVSPMPGATTRCQTFPVMIDGREILRFTDTPGFQNPMRVGAELQKLAEESGDCIARFRQAFKDTPHLSDDVELLAPVERGAAIIYVVDGSRPVRNVDLTEMEILRLSGRPRMAIINCKDDDDSHLQSWKNAFRRNFNANRLFNAHRASYAERLLLLQAMEAIDQDLQPLLDTVVTAFKADWKRRNQQTVEVLLDLFTECLQTSVSAFVEEEDLQGRQKLADSYKKRLETLENTAHERIRALYKHNLFRYTLPESSLLNEELFSERTWELLGLSTWQIAVVGGIGGAAIGAGVDLAAGGAALGLATGLAGVVGAVGALWGGRRLSQEKVLGFRLGGERIRFGPAKDINLLFVLINRALLYYRYTINWAHGRRDIEKIGSGLSRKDMVSTTSEWSTGKLQVARGFFAAVTENKDMEKQLLQRQRLAEILYESLGTLSKAE